MEEEGGGREWDPAGLGDCTQTGWTANKTKKRGNWQAAEAKQD